ncbi:MAG TPA: DsbA family oxidoreductase [Longimicrobiaceae bacterium]|nr:DsbA family oxidoreductase [Longimicrobiaceae bacterium]
MTDSGIETPSQGITGMNIEIWSDVVCPWCYIGKRRLERALEEFEQNVEVVWRSFELDPSAPTEPIGKLDEHLAEKYGTSVEQARGMMDQMARAGAEEGLALNFDRAQRGNTLDAHRLIHLAATQGVQSEMKERLFRAYMTEGKAISDRNELANLAGEVGLDAEEVRAMLDTDAFVEDVRADELRARHIGVSGVPFFVIDGRFGVSGAQSAEVLLEGLRRAAGE